MEDTKKDTEVEVTTGPDGEKIEETEEKPEEKKEEKKEEKPEEEKVEVETEEKPEEKVEEKKEEEEEKKPEERFVTKDRFNEVNEEKNELKQRLSRLEQQFSTEKDESYKKTRAEKKARLIQQFTEDGDDNAKATEKAEGTLMVDDSQREIKVLKQQIANAQRPQATSIDSVLNEVRGQLPESEQKNFDTLKEYTKKRMAQVSPEFHTTEVGIDAYYLIKGRNIDKLKAPPKTDANKQIVDQGNKVQTRTAPAKTIKVKLTQDQIDYCKTTGKDPVEYAKQLLDSEKGKIAPEESVKI